MTWGNCTWDVTWKSFTTLICFTAYNADTSLHISHNYSIPGIEVQGWIKEVRVKSLWVLFTSLWSGCNHWSGSLVGVLSTRLRACKWQSTILGEAGRREGIPRRCEIKFSYISDLYRIKPGVGTVFPPIHNSQRLSILWLPKQAYSQITIQCNNVSTVNELRMTPWLDSPTTRTRAKLEYIPTTQAICLPLKVSMTASIQSYLRIEKRHVLKKMC